MKKLINIVVVFISFFANAQNFHDTQGKLEISNSGQATYTLPIAMPSSIKDVGPIINLVYASGQTTGIAGQGWNINSISTISRMATRQDIDGFKDGVDFDDNDKLALDGQRLLLKTGTYWADGSTYETEVQSNSKIELKINGTQIYFIVTNTDGSRSWYGNYGGMNATDLNAFYVVRFEDTFGNFMTYHYNLTSPNNISGYWTYIQIGVDEQYNPEYDYIYVPAITSSNTITIAEIKFSANTLTNPTPLNSIKFTYKFSNRYLDNAYLKGEKIQNIDILDKIEVFTNNLLFKRYQLTHDDSQKLTKLQEFNTAGEPANPVLFEYNPNQGGATESTAPYTDTFDASNPPTMSGDFDGDGYGDMVRNDKAYTNLFNGAANYGIPLPFTAGTRTTFAATTLIDATTPFVTGYKLNQKQSLVNAVETDNQISFNVYNYNNQFPFNGFSNSYTKTISKDNVAVVKRHSFGNPNTSTIVGSYTKNSNVFLEGDYNGDGVSEILMISTINEERMAISVQYYAGIVSQFNQGIEYYLIDTKPASSTILNTNGFTKIHNVVLADDSISSIQPPFYSTNNYDSNKRFVMDFNSDGKSDLLIIKPNGTYKVVGFKQLLAAPWVELEIIGQGTIDEYSTTKQMLMGDYNGDGKPDIMLPDNESGGATWHIYYSNPKLNGGELFEKISQPTSFEYLPIEGDHIDNTSRMFFALDTDKDGKTDIVRATLRQYRPGGMSGWGGNRDTEWQIHNFKNNGGYFMLDYGSPNTHASDDRDKPIIIPSNYRKNGKDSELLVIRYHPTNNFPSYTTFVNFNADKGQECLLTKITQSNGAIIDQITYSPMVDNSTYAGNGHYSSAESALYPNIEIKKIKQNYLVTQLINNSLGVVKKQDFKYHGYVANLTSVGSIGFKKTARSSWHRTASDKKMWSVQENDPLMRGANIKSFSVLLNANEDFNFSTNYSTQKINQTDNEFIQSTDNVSKRYRILLKSQRVTNFQTNVINETLYDYDPIYLLPTIVTKNNYLGTVLQGTSYTNTVFDNSIIGTGNNYFIGRPKEVTTKTTAYGDSKSLFEKYYYTNGNVSKTEKTPNGDPVTMVEEFDYFANGLLKLKKISAIGTPAATALAPRTTSYTYDPTNRFVKTTTDIEGLVTTNLTYDSLYGTVLKQQNPFGQITTSTIDNWGKQTKVTDFLGKSITYGYTRTGNIYTTIQTGDDGSCSMAESDALARVIRKGAKDLNGNWVYANTEYDYLGRTIKQSEPYFAGATPSQWSVKEYDDFSRIIRSTAHTGKVVNNTYNGLTATASDSVLTKTKTMNANGHEIIATDMPGGTINFKYDATGNLLESDYDGIKVKMQYDNWGRKKLLDDTSAGIYNYTYDAFGQILTEDTPKGITTYTYTPFGKIETKKVLAYLPGTRTPDSSNTTLNTSITSTYTYDPIKKWLTKMTVVNPNDGNSNYSYSYDTAGTNPTYQLNNTVEEIFPTDYSRLPVAIFTKQLKFDTFGRVNTETSTAKAHDTGSSKIITHAYKNGIKWQLLDGTKVLWQANTTDARGQLLTGMLGNGINITNSYDVFGYNTQNKHLLGTTNVMSLKNEFEPILGNLTSRYNSMFDNLEYFQYDNLDRLIRWTGGAPEILGNLTFPTTVEGFVYQESVGTTCASCGVRNENQKLKVIAKGFEAGASKIIITNATAGKEINLKFDCTQVAGTADVFVKIEEIDPNNNGLVIETTDYGLVQINNNLQYTVVNDANIRLSFYIGNVFMKTQTAANSAMPPNGGGYTATFYIDNVLITAPKTQTQSYDDRGRITANNLGDYNYLITGKPYQNSSIYPSPEATAYYINRRVQDIEYNTFKAPIKIAQTGGETIYFGYNASEQRQIMYYGASNTNKLLQPYRRYYSADGSMEIKATFGTASTTAPKEVEFITYIGGSAYTAPIVLKSDGVKQSYFYLHRDYQGSVMAITNSIGAVVEKRLFDPWGGITKVQNGAGNTLGKLTFFDRGYTGHEHLEGVGLINMNARLYDPKLHRFLQPDALIQDPYNTQNYNRYSYCVNNPLKYTDISGNDFGISLLIAVGVAVLTNVMTNYIAGTPITFGSIIQTVGMTVFSSVVTFGIGDVVNTIGNLFVRATVQALAHGAFQGGLTAMNGGNFWNGFAAGALSSIASSLWQGGSHKTTNSEGVTSTRTINGIGGVDGGGTTSMIAFGTIAGGAGAALTGGNFWQGAVTGLIVSGLNHAMHQMGNDGETEDPPKYKYKDKIYEDKAKLYGDILLDQAAEQFGIKDVLALGAGLSGYNIIPTRGKFEGAIKGTSLNSKLSRNITLSVEKASFGMLKKLPTLTGGPFTGAPLRKMMVNTIGKFLGRTLGPIGWGMLAYDVGMTFYNTQQIYNSITNGK